MPVYSRHTSRDLPWAWADPGVFVMASIKIKLKLYLAPIFKDFYFRKKSPDDIPLQC